MFISEETLDDLMNEVLRFLLNQSFTVQTSRGNSSEVTGILLHLKNPRARLSRTETKGRPFSSLGELLWYLSKDNDLDFITYYLSRYKEESDDNKTIYGGYGPRLFRLRGKIDQVSNVIKLLRIKPNTRRAVIQLFDGEDIEVNHKEIPCTCTLQFFIRNNRLEMFAAMRSNDAYKGLPHDIFAFTMLQEIIARTLNVELGEYKHAVGSLHLYEIERGKAEQYLNEGIQSTKYVMPSMPVGDPWGSIDTVLLGEAKIRSNQEFNESEHDLNDYWCDLIRILKIYSKYKLGDKKAIKVIQEKMVNHIYKTYIDKKIS